MNNTFLQHYITLYTTLHYSTQNAFYKLYTTLNRTLHILQDSTTLHDFYETIRNLTNITQKHLNKTIHNFTHMYTTFTHIVHKLHTTLHNFTTCSQEMYTTLHNFTQLYTNCIQLLHNFTHIYTI